MSEIKELITLGKNVRQYREAAGMSLQQLADKSDVDITCLIRLEYGKYDIDVEELFIIAKILNVHAGKLLV